MTTAQIGFISFALASQALLVAFFAARRWWPDRARGLGNAAYGVGALGGPLGILLLVAGGNEALVPGPLLLAGWASFGAVVDVLRPRPWRGPPVEWKVFAPYVAVYVAAQMFLWWPLWAMARPAWTAFLGLFALNTALNVAGHGRPRPHGTGGPGSG